MPELQDNRAEAPHCIANTSAEAVLNPRENSFLLGIFRSL